MRDVTVGDAVCMMRDGGDAVCRMRDAVCRMRDAVCRMRDVVSDLQGHRSTVTVRSYCSANIRHPILQSVWI